MQSHFNALSDDTLTVLANYLDLNTLRSLSVTTSRHAGLFSNHLAWLKKIRETLHVSDDDASLLPFLGQDSTWLAEGYKRFQKLKTFIHWLSPETQSYAQDESNHFQLFICASDDLPTFLSICNPSEFMLHYECSLYLSATCIPKYLYLISCKYFSNVHADNPDVIQNFKMELLEKTTLSGRLDLVQFLFECEDRIEKPLSHHLLHAAASGNIELFKYYVDTHQLSLSSIVAAPASDADEGDGIDNDINPLNYAALRGHCEMFKYLLNLKIAIDENTLDHAARSGSRKLVQYLIEDHQCKPNNETLTCAILAGNQELYDFLKSGNFPNIKMSKIGYKYYALSKNTTFQYQRLTEIIQCSTIRWKKDHLCSAIAMSGNMQLLNDQLIKNSMFRQKFANHMNLYTAAANGQLKIVQFILDKNHARPIPDKRTLEEAIKSENYPLVRFLLKKFRKWYVDVNHLNDMIPLCKRRSAIESILDSHRFFVEALNLITMAPTSEPLTHGVISSYTKSITMTLKNAFQCHPEHCATFFYAVFNYPILYAPNPNTLSYLHLEFSTLLKTMQNEFTDSTSPFLKRIVFKAIEWLKENAAGINETIQQCGVRNKQEEAEEYMRQAKPFG